MRLPNRTHTDRPWRIHEVIPDFRLEDVWALPTPGGPGDFPRLLGQVTAGSSETASGAAGALWAIRWKLGELLGWDTEDATPPTIRDRLPADLRDGPRGPEFAALPFTPVYLTDDEFAAEIVNATVHGVMHLGWVPDGAGGYRGEMAVYVKPKGRFGNLYMAAIKPFRYLIVYPAMLREAERRWATGERPSPATPSVS